MFFYSGEALKTVQNKVSVPVQAALNPGFSSASLPLILPEGVTASSVQGSEGMNAVSKGNTLELTAASAVSGNGLAFTLNLDFSGVKNSQETGYDIAFGRATADSASAYGIAFSVSHQYYSNPDVIRVTVNWGTMEFEYDDGQWNTDTHVWENAGWKSSGNTVELINEGNVSVRAGLSYDAAEGYEGINGSFTNEAGSPVEEEILLSPNGANKSHFHLDGSTGNRWTESVAIGHITVTLK